MLYRCTEKFFSIQGEGYWTGTPMAFCRLAHCPVGKVPGICRSWTGATFLCDTGASYPPALRVAEHHAYTEVNERLSPEAIWEWAADRVLCLTGGEPLAVPLRPLLDAAGPASKLHVETSGTVYQELPGWAWVTVSPKEGCLEAMVTRADELKVLVDQTVTLEQVVSRWSRYRGALPGRIFLQPVEDADPEQSRRNVLHTITLCERGHFRLSLQQHKFLRIR